MLLTKVNDKVNYLPQLTILDSDGRHIEETGSMLTNKKSEAVSSRAEQQKLVDVTLKRAHARMGFGPLLSVLDNYMAA
ncbi:MAG: hypothetical protein K2Z81_21380 [Cyanobacteria bacterium]|nr:hypothetical protein [Cyanobacteriota bacterium]